MTLTPIPIALRHLFQLELTPSSLVREAAGDLERIRSVWETAEVQRAVKTLGILVNDSVDWRSLWARQELEATTKTLWGAIAYRAEGTMFNKTVLELFEDVERLLLELPEGSWVGVGLPVQIKRYRFAPLIRRSPGVPLAIHFLGDVTTLAVDDEFSFSPGRLEFPAVRRSAYQIVALLFGLSLATTKERISRARDEVGKRRRRPFEKKGPAAARAK